MEHFQLSAQAYDLIRMIARTIAGLDGAESIGMAHISEATCFHSPDRGEIRPSPHPPATYPYNM